jgi:fructose-bisphosphate aldolase / 6-deoxy-5-ketofructose 1-phosphate synthase
MNAIIVPCDIPQKSEAQFIENYQALTNSSDRLFIFSCDHKMEHLDKVAPDHLFTIAHKSKIGAMATHLGLVCRYAHRYAGINYIIKLNGTTCLRSPNVDPVSRLLWEVDSVAQIKKEKSLAIRGVGITVYLGSEFQDGMLAQAAAAITKAHQHGLVAMVWMYPRGSGVVHNADVTELLAGCVAVATSLGADIVKIKSPLLQSGAGNSEWIIPTLQSAGNTKIVCAGEQKTEPAQLFENIKHYLKEGISGMAIGRNIFDRPVDQAIDIANKISALIYGK